MRALLGALALLCLASQVSARPLRVDDLLHTQSLASTSIDPSGRWLILEVERPYDEAAHFEAIGYSRTARSQLELVDLRAPAAARPAFPQDGTMAYLRGPFSPSGQRFLAFRQKDTQREGGLVDLATGTVRWLGVGADFGDKGATAIWRSDHQLVMLALVPGDRTVQDRTQLSTMLDLPGLWRNALHGLSATSIGNGSGRFKDVHPTALDKHLTLVNADTGAVQVLATGDFESLVLSPDGARLAVVIARERLQPEPDQLITPGSEQQRHTLAIYDLRSRAVFTPCPPCDVLPDSLRWSSKGRLMLLAKTPDQPWAQGVLMQVDPRASAAKPIAMDGVRPDVSYRPQEGRRSCMPTGSAKTPSSMAPGRAPKRQALRL